MADCGLLDMHGVQVRCRRGVAREFANNERMDLPTIRRQRLTRRYTCSNWTKAAITMMGPASSE
jgi:hypothetical protein